MKQKVISVVCAVLMFGALIAVVGCGGSGGGGSNRSSSNSSSGSIRGSGNEKVNA